MRQYKVTYSFIIYLPYHRYNKTHSTSCDYGDAVGVILTSRRFDLVEANAKIGV